MRFSDPVESRRNRLRVVIALVNAGNIKVVLRELLVRSLPSSVIL